MRELILKSIKQGNTWLVLIASSQVVIGMGETERKAFENAQNSINNQISELNVINHEIHDALHYC